MTCKIQTLTTAAFNKYGTILQFTEKMSDGWEILVTSDSPGWRIALLEFSRKSTRKLEYHPDSKESGVKALSCLHRNHPYVSSIFNLIMLLFLRQQHRISCIEDRAYFLRLS